MRMRMLTAISAAALCLAAFSPAQAGSQGGGGGDGHNHHGGHHGGHNGGHHGGGHGHHGHDRDREVRDFGCEEHWDRNIAFGNATTNPNCGNFGLGVSIIAGPNWGVVRAPGLLPDEAPY